MKKYISPETFSIAVAMQGALMDTSRDGAAMMAPPEESPSGWLYNP